MYIGSATSKVANRHERNASVFGRFALRSNRTVLVERYHEAPLKIAKTFRQNNSDMLFVHLLDASPGMLDGDLYDVSFTLESDTHVYMTNQTFTKAHPVTCCPARLTQRFHLADRAVLHYFPEPLIPFKDSQLDVYTSIRLGNDAILFFADIITPGRVHFGEQFAFRNLTSHFETYRGERLVAWDRFTLRPAEHKYTSPASFGSYTHFGSFWIFSERCDEKLADLLRNRIPNQDDLMIGMSNTGNGDIIVRILGFRAWRLQEAMKCLWDEACLYLLGHHAPEARR